MNCVSDDIRHGTFGEFLVAKRREKGIPSMTVTDALSISPGYYCDIEKNRRKPPERIILAKIVQALHLSKAEVAIFYDLAGKARYEAPPDLPDYINQSEVVRVALRLAKDKGNDDDWHRFIFDIERRSAEED